MLTDADLVDLPLESNTANRLLMFDALPWNVQFYYDRHWHLFQQTSELAFAPPARQRGADCAQCNIKKLPDAELR